MILQVKDFNKRFGSSDVIKNVSFEVEKGKIFGVAGPNGAGKSTLFNLIAGMLPLDTGEIIFNGKNINRLKSHQICHRGISRTFQIPIVFSTMTISENIEVGIRFGAQMNPKGRIAEILNFVGLQEKGDVVAKHVNLLDKKLLMLAAALAAKPKLLLLDEPIGGLSPTEAVQTLTLFKKINKQLGVTIIIIEHLMKVIMEIAEKLMILNNGENICIGPPREVMQDNLVRKVYLG